MSSGASCAKRRRSSCTWTRRSFFLGIFCLALIFALASIKARWVKVVPPQVIAAAVGLVLGWFLGLKGDRLIHIPEASIQERLPVCRISPRLFTNHSLWWGRSRRS